MTRPDILWIVTTQWRGQACGYAGDPNARTPHLDALAATGVNHAQAVTPHPFGPFARAALLTGVPSPRNGVRDYFDPLPVSARTVAHRLGEVGYATAFFGKWHLGSRDPGAPLVGEAHAKTLVPPEARGGFGHWVGFESGFLLNDPWLHGTGLNAPTRVPGYQSDVVCQRAAEWVAEQTRSGSPLRAQPEARSWFVVVSLEPPHPPYGAPAPGAAVRDPGAIVLPRNVPRGGEAEARARRELAGYYAHIEATDRAIGRLLAAVPADNTIVVFTSVHGDMHGAHGLFRKGWPYEESVRVPLLVRFPPAVRHPCPSVSDEPVSLLDVSRWTVTWARGGQAAGRSGEMSRPQAQPISMPAVVALPDQCDRAWRGIRTATRKIVLTGDGEPWLFFDLAADPDEMHNLAGDPGCAAEIRAWSQSLVE
jgi:arylsulfatase A-like enzyme